jgi:putative ABC transport system permease protein
MGAGVAFAKYQTTVSRFARSSRTECGVCPAIRREWDRLVPGVQLLNIHTGREQVDRSLAPQRAAAGFLSGFALLSLVLVFSGLFASMAYSVSARTREIGIRTAVGARSEIIVFQVLRQAFSLAALGIAAGIPLSLTLARLMASEIRGVSAGDPATFGAVALLALAVTAVAAWLPARRASRVDPAKTLRCE